MSEKRKATIKLEIEVEYEPSYMHGDDQESIDWFRDKVIFNPDPGEELILHSNCIGESIGNCRVTRIVSWSAVKLQYKSKPDSVGYWIFNCDGCQTVFEIAPNGDFKIRISGLPEPDYMEPPEGKWYGPYASEGFALQAMYSMSGVR